MITINTTIAAIAAALEIPEYPTQEVIRRLFLTSQPVPLPEKVRYISDVGIGSYASLTPEYLTIYRTLHGESKVKDVASLLAYIKAAVVSVMDLSKWQEYTGSKATKATGEPWEKPWVPHYPPQGVYAVYPPSKDPEAA